MASVWFDGVDQMNTLVARLAGERARIGRDGAKVVRRNAARVERLARAFCPVDTGHLQSTIGTDFDGDGRGAHMEAVIGPTANYAPYVEFGTHRMAPHAFLGPALDRVGPAFIADVEALADPFS